MKTKIFDTLYGSDSKGKIKIWNIKVTLNDDNITATISTEYGLENGKQQSNTKIIKKGKNIGKKNETTPFQQAVSEATSKFNKKIKENYFTSKDNLNNASFRPMLALDYKNRSKSITFPCYIQPKFDGIRANLYLKDNCIKLISRKGNDFPHLNHIKESAKKILNKYPDIILDGELYTTDISFQKITGICRRETLKKEDTHLINLIKFWCFDIYDKNNTSLSFEKRFNKLKEISNDFDNNFVLADTQLFNESQKTQEIVNSYIEKGFEGIMFRNKSGPYKPDFRSKDLQKLKNTFDSEFTIIGFDESVDGNIVWVCEYTNTKTNQNSTFTATPKISHSIRKELLKKAKNNFNQFKNKKLTVRYQELTDEGCPRFPVAIDIRDYE